MGESTLSVAVATWELESGVFWSEAPLLPQTAYCSDFGRRSQKAVLKRLPALLQEQAGEQFQNLIPPAAPELVQVELDLEPPTRSSAWVEPVRLRFDVLRWMQGQGMFAAYVPELGIAVLAERADRLEKRVVSHIRFALLREGLGQNLRGLAMVQRAARMQVETEAIALSVSSPKQQKLDSLLDDRDEDLEALKKAAGDLTNTVLRGAWEVDEPVARLAEALRCGRGGSVLLVGPSGVGKTAIVHQLVLDRERYGLADRAFFTTSGARLIAGMGGFGMWQERCRKICRAAAKQRAVLHVGGLVELMEVGKGGGNAVGMASFLRPYLLWGELNVIAECTPEELPIVEQADPHLIQAFFRVDVDEPDGPSGRKILVEAALNSLSSGRAGITDDALDLMDRLHRRYATYSAYPGRPVRFLENLLRDCPKNQSVGPRDVLRVFSRETGIPEAILDEQAPLDLTATRAWFDQRVLGQPEALAQVVDLLAMIKSRLARPGKPLASLLFAGPTGVGKTETAKVLAAFLFGDRERLVRFDMSEYADPFASRRLIGGVEHGEGLLTRAIREQPFSVLLLDEFEKAHGDVFDLLLQVLGEGRLTDQKGRTADFRNAVVIMTSNLGAGMAGRVPLGITGARDERAVSREHFRQAVRDFFRPEMFNRIDALIAFAPLDEPTLRRIVERELDLIRNRDGFRLRGVDLTLSGDVAGRLVRQGYDPRYGARPMKRVTENEVITPLASRLNAYSDDVLLSCTVSEGEGRLRVDVAVLADANAKERMRVQAGGKNQPGREQHLTRVLARCATLRRRMHRLRTSRTMLELDNEIHRLELLQRRYKARAAIRGEARAGAWMLGNVAVADILQRLPGLHALDGEAARLIREVVDLEERLLLDFHEAPEPSGRSEEAGPTAMEPAQADQCLADLGAALDDLLLRLHVRRFARPDQALVGVYGDNPAWTTRLAEAYAALAAAAQGQVSAEQVSVGRDAARKRRVLVREPIPDLPRFFANPPGECIGVILAMAMAMAFPLLVAEEGRHVFQDKGAEANCLVHVSEADLSGYVLPAGVERSGNLKLGRARRTYDCEACRLSTDQPGRWRPFNPDSPLTALEEQIRERLLADASRPIQGGDCS